MGLGPWALGLGPWALGLGPWALGRGPWALGLGPWALGLGPWALGRAGLDWAGLAEQSSYSDIEKKTLVVAAKPHHFSREEIYPYYLVLKTTMQLRALRGLKTCFMDSSRERELPYPM